MTPGRPLTPGVVEQWAGVSLLALARTPTPPEVVLGERERKVLEGFTGYPLRQAEWLAGRHAAKQLLQLAFGLEPGRAEILPAESGAPELHAEAVTLCLSLSHTDAWVVAAAAPLAVGVDVADDEDGERLPRIARRVFSEGEAEACGAHESIANQAAVWALKEAGLKLRVGGVFSPGARSVRVVSLQPPRVADESMQVELYRLPSAAVAVARTR